VAWWEKYPVVSVSWDPDRRARLVRRGPEVSEVVWEDVGREQYVSNHQLGLDEESGEMITITTNTRGETQMGAKKDYAAMTGPELVAEYNRLSPAKTVKRFASHADGVKRVARLAGGDGAAKTKAKTKRAGTDGQKPISVEFGSRPGTNQERLLLSLHSRLGRQVPVGTVLKEVYGSANEKNLGALAMVVRGLVAASARLSYEVKRERRDGESTIGIHARK
jgi:hypothetical protein